jgi:hypothetical protein
MALRYTGETGVVRFGDRPLLHGETLSGPDDLLEALEKRGDFERVADEPKKTRAKKAAPQDPED